MKDIENMDHFVGARHWAKQFPRDVPFIHTIISEVILRIRKLKPSFR